MNERDNLRADSSPAPSPDSARATGLPTNEEEYVVARRHPRAKCFLAVEVRPEQEGWLMLGKLSDVSLGGCCVETPTLLSTGAAVAISPLEASGLLWVKGIAVNARMAEGAGNFKIGIKFLEADPAPSHSLQEFLRFVEECRAKQAPYQPSYLGRVAGH